MPVQAFRSRLSANLLEIRPERIAKTQAGPRIAEERTERAKCYLDRIIAKPQTHGKEPGTTRWSRIDNGAVLIRELAGWRGRGRRV